MKASDKPQFSSKWWTGEKPASLKGNELDKALVRVEKALGALKRKTDDERTIKDCLEALGDVSAAANKTIKNCDKREHKDVIAVLKKYDALVDAEVSRLQRTKTELAAGQAGDGQAIEDDVNDDALFDKDYLYKMMKLLKSTGKELRFGFGLNTNAPEGSVLLLKRKGKPELLFKVLKKTKQFSNRLLTYGYALADPEDGQTLVFRLESGANEPPRIVKLGRKFLRADKKLRFRKLKVILSGGKVLEDLEANEDEMGEAAIGADQAGDLGAQLAQAESFVELWNGTLRQVEGQVAALRQAMEPFEDPSIQAVYQGLGNVMASFPDLDLTRLAAAARANDMAAYNRVLEQTAREVDQVHDVLANSPLLSTIDENPFVNSRVHDTVIQALNRIVSGLGV